MSWLNDRIAEFNAILADYTTVATEDVETLNGLVASFIASELAAADTEENVAAFLDAHMRELKNDVDNRTTAQLADFSAAGEVPPNGLATWVATDLATLTDLYDDYTNIATNQQASADNRFAHWIVRMLCSAGTATTAVATYKTRLADLKAMIALRLQQEIDNLDLVVPVS